VMVNSRHWCSLGENDANVRSEHATTVSSSHSNSAQAIVYRSRQPSLVTEARTRKKVENPHLISCGTKRWLQYEPCRRHCWRQQTCCISRMSAQQSSPESKAAPSSRHGTLCVTLDKKMQDRLQCVHPSRRWGQERSTNWNGFST
jgi:hypothetical protein